MKNTFLVVLIISFAIAVPTMSCSQNATTTVTQSQTIHELVVKTVVNENIPGMIAAIADSNGIRLIESAGVRKEGASEIITISDIFHLGSCTKAMTSALLATFVAKGEIHWETTIIEVFPELKGVIHSDFYNVTLRQLVTHTAGIKPNAKDWSAFGDEVVIERRLSIMKENLKNSGTNAAGEFNYSNLGYMIAGSMAERVCGQPWETLMKSRLFDPLGMTTAGFGPPGTIGEVDQPWGHDKLLTKWQAKQVDNPEALGPAGRVHSSFDDWAKFIALFLMKGNTTVLGREQLNQLIDPIDNYAGGWSVVQRDWAKGIAITHSGSNTMWYVNVWIAPELNRAYMVGTNSSDKNTPEIADYVIGELIRLDQDTP